MAYPLPTDLVNASSGPMYNIFVWANTVTDGIFVPAILAAFCIVLFIATSRYSTERAFGFAGLVGMMGSILLLIAGLMTWKIATAFIAAGVIGLVWMISKKDYFAG